MACRPFLTMVRMRTRRMRCVSRARRSRVAGSGTQTVGKRSWRRRSRICSASRRSVFVLRTTMARNPDGGEAIVAQQVEDMQRVAPIGFRLAHDHGANLRGIADEHRVPKALHEGVKPDRVARALDTASHRPRPRRIEL